MVIRRADKKMAHGNSPFEIALRKHSHLYTPLLICFLGIIIYANSFGCSFHYDDIHTFVNNETIRDLNSVQSVLMPGRRSKLIFPARAHRFSKKSSAANSPLSEQSTRRISSGNNRQCR